MITIQPEKAVFTLINVFQVKPENQQPLVDLLMEAGITMKELPGFISSSLHKSLDGKQVINYAQWQTQRDFDAMQHNSKAAPHMKAAADLSEGYTPIMTEVAGVVS